MYVLQFQFAHHQHHEFEERSASTEEVLKAFGDFDWAGECNRASQLQRVSPTISIRDYAGCLLWISAYADAEQRLQYLCGHEYPGVVSRLFGLWKTKGTVSTASGELGIDQVRLALDAFLNGRQGVVAETLGGS